MKISVCIYARNEEEHLENCILSVLGIADEIILLDNNSTDCTVDIAKKYHCRIKQVRDNTNIEGINRNQYLEDIEADWIIVLDPDECFDEEGAKRLIAACNAAPDDVLRIQLPKYEYLGKGLFLDRQINSRCFRYHPDIQYSQQAMHCSIFMPKDKLYKTTYVNAPIHHYGILNKAKTEVKRESYREKIIQSIISPEESKTLPFMYVMLGAEYCAIDNYTEAHKLYRTAKELAISDFDKLVANMHMAFLYAKMNDYESAKREAHLVIEIDSIWQERAYDLFALLAYRERNLDECENNLRKSLSFRTTAPTLLNLASLLYKEQPEQAKCAIEKALQLNPYLLNPKIYGFGASQNTFEFQSCYLPIFTNIFDIMISITEREELTNNEHVYWKLKKSETIQ